MLTDEQITTYISGGGLHCLLCKSENVRSGSTSIVGECRYQEYTCDDCKESWVGIYQLVGVEYVAYCEGGVPSENGVEPASDLSQGINKETV